MQASSNIDKQIGLGFKQAKLITKNCAQTFYFASHFLSQKKRNAVYSIYAICRLSDDSVDQKGKINARQRIKTVEEKVSRVYNDAQVKDCLLLAFKETLQKYQIPKRYFDQLIEGMYMDLDKNRYRDFEELYIYCYKVAAVVGLIMLKVFSYADPEAENYAVDLGIAMQLTNILRDIKEDFNRGRIYLPQKEMQRFGVSETDIAKENVNDNFVSLLRYQIERARSYYRRSALGIDLINERSSRFVVRAMKEIYSAILQTIEKNDYDVFSQRAYVNTKDKIAIAAKVLFKG